MKASARRSSRARFPERAADRPHARQRRSWSPHPVRERFPAPLPRWTDRAAQARLGGWRPPASRCRKITGASRWKVYGSAPCRGPWLSSRWRAKKFGVSIANACCSTPGRQPARELQSGVSQGDRRKPPKTAARRSHERRRDVLLQPARLADQHRRTSSGRRPSAPGGCAIFAAMAIAPTRRCAVVARAMTISAGHHRRVLTTLRALHHVLQLGRLTTARQCCG